MNTLPLAISRSSAFRHLLSRIGSATYRFNTTLVGLSCISQGQGDGGSIAVTWTKPKTPEQCENTAAQARTFASAGAIVLAVDVFDSFLRDFPTESWLGFTAKTRAIATKESTRPRDQGGAYSVAERAAAIAAELRITDNTSIALIDLMARWRNIVVHDVDRRIPLPPETKSTLLGEKDFISKNYSHLSIEEAIKNFSSRKVPVPKEVTSLIANAVRCARAFDEAAIRRVASTEQGTESAVKDILYSHLRCLQRDQLRARVSDLLQGKQERRIAALIKLLSSLGVSNTESPVSAPISREFLQTLLSSTKDFIDNNPLE